MRAKEFVAETQLFKNQKVKDKVYDILVQATDSGPFDGGCVVFAQALQMLLGGDIVVLTNPKDRADHAVVKVGNTYWDFDGPTGGQDMLDRFARNEHTKVTGIRPIENSDLPDAPRDAHAAARIASMLADPQVTEDNQRVYYHGTKAAEDFDKFEVGKAAHGFQTIDRLLGPHFSGTPALANKFALGDPNVSGRAATKFGGRVIPVHLSGEIYTLPQARGEEDFAALARDLGNTVFAAYPELYEKFKQAWFKQDVPNGGPEEYKRWHNMQFEHTPGFFGRWGKTYLTSMLDVSLAKELAMAYKQLLVSQGYGIIKYRNTGRKERVGLRGEDLDSFIALAPPKFKFSRE